MTDATYILGIELTANSFTNVTGDCLRLSINRSAHTLEIPLRDSQMQVVLNNNQDGYSPLNESASYFGLLKINTAIQLSCNYLSNSYWLFKGSISKVNVSPAWPKTVSITAGDNIQRLLREKTKSTLYLNTFPSSLFATLVENTQVSSYTSDGDFSDPVNIAWWRNVLTATALKDIVEYGNYWLYQTAGGTLTLKGRYFNVSSTVTQSYNEFSNVSFQYSDDNVVNNQIVKVKNRISITDVATIGFLVPDQVKISANGNTSFWIDFIDPDNVEENTPAQNVITPVQSIDFTAWTEANASGINETSGVTVSTVKFASTMLCSLSNSSALEVYLNKFIVRGESLQRLPDLSAESIDSTSELNYGKQESVIDNKLISNIQYAQAYADFLIAEKKDPSATVSIEIKNIYPDVLSHELSDILHIKEANTGVNSLFSIITIDHSIDLQSGVEHSISIGLTDYKTRSLLILDQTPGGVLGGTRELGF